MSECHAPVGEVEFSILRETAMKMFVRIERQTQGDWIAAGLALVGRVR